MNLRVYYSLSFRFQICPSLKLAVIFCSTVILSITICYCFSFIYAKYAIINLTVSIPKSEQVFGITLKCNTTCLEYLLHLYLLYAFFRLNDLLLESTNNTHTYLVSLNFKAIGLLKISQTNYFLLPLLINYIRYVLRLPGSKLRKIKLAVLCFNI